MTIRLSIPLHVLLKNMGKHIYSKGSGMQQQALYCIPQSPGMVGIKGHLEVRISINAWSLVFMNKTEDVTWSSLGELGSYTFCRYVGRA